MLHLTDQGTDLASETVDGLSDGHTALSIVRSSVLILDDDRKVAETMALMVKSVGSHARISHTAEEFFREWERSAADVAIIDLQMPGVDGLDVIHQLAKIGGAQVIISSGFDPRVLEAARHAALNQGLTVVGILQKPVRRGALKNLLDLVQTQRRSQQAPNSLDASSVSNMAALQVALSHGQIRPYFQPKVRLRDRALHGFEALARWEHPELGLIGPDLFLPQIEMHGLAWKMTEVVINQAVDFLSQLSDQNITVAVNVSMKICSDAKFTDFLTGVIACHDVSPGRLILEVTEAGPLEISQQQIDALTRLRMQGFCLSIDDFGTGVSTLERLVRIPFNELKVDRFFSRAMSTSPEAEELVRNLIRIAASMHMSVTIEGIEDAATMQLCESLGCEFGQGYYISKPIRESKVREWMSEWSHRIEVEALRKIVPDVAAAKILGQH